MSIEQPALWETPAEPSRARTWLWPCVAASVLCFLPLGLVAVYYALRAESARSRGDEAGLLRAAKVARRWLVVTIVIGLLLELVIVGALFLLGAGG